MLLRRLSKLAMVCAASCAVLAIGPVHDEPLPGSDEEDELDEVEDLPTDTQAPSVTLSSEAPVTPPAMAVDELKFSQEELRSRFAYMFAAGLGNGKPWQGYTLEMGAILAKDRTVAMSLGAGSFKESGFLEERAYDVSGRSRAIAFALREYSRHFPHLALELVVGYGDWSGRVDPHGSDTDEPADDADTEALKLSSGFNAHGLIFGVGLGCSWLWDNGFYLDWTPLGLHASKLLQRELDRDTRVVERAVTFAIERPLFYGLMNLKLGYLF